MSDLTPVVHKQTSSSTLACGASMDVTFLLSNQIPDGTTIRDDRVTCPACRDSGGGQSTPTPDTTAPTMSDKDWRTLRKTIQDNVDRYEREPKLQGVRDGLKAALAYMDGIEQYRGMVVPAAGSVEGTTTPAERRETCMVDECPAAQRCSSGATVWHDRTPDCPPASAGSGTAALTDDHAHAHREALRAIGALEAVRRERDNLAEQVEKVTRLRVEDVDRLTGFLERVGWQVCTSCGGRGGTATREEVNPCGDCGGFCLMEIVEEGDGGE